jgi:hypothetical protein
MKVADTHSHLFALDKLMAKRKRFSEISEILCDDKVIFWVERPNEINGAVNNRFSKHGWADKIKVGNSRLTIGFAKQKVGVCFQLGNVARTYADILKLAQLGKRNVIDIGVIVVPNKEESKLLGKNYARFDRLSSEISHFQDIINLPILIVGLSN